MDGAPDGGGRNLAPRPMEVLLAGAGGCTAYDVVVILKKNDQEVTGCEVALQAERAASDPKVFTTHPLPLHGARPQPEAQSGRAGGAPVAREVLLGDGDARQDRRDQQGIRDYRSVNQRTAAARSMVRSNAMRNGGHHLCHHPHGKLDCLRQFRRAEFQRSLPVLRLVGAHRFDNRAGPAIAGRKPRQMPVEVLLDLALGFGQKAEAMPVAKRTRRRAERERAAVPERIEQAQAPAEFADAAGAPGEVILLLRRPPAASARRLSGARAVSAWPW